MSATLLATKLIKSFEDFEALAYPDPLHGWEVPTIGYGTTRYPNGSKVRKGDKVSESEARALLAHEIEANILPSMRKIPNWAKLNEYRQAATIDFAYNLGAYFYRAENFGSITRLLDLSLIHI